jgi:hypothetical protein
MSKQQGRLNRSTATILRLVSAATMVLVSLIGASAASSRGLSASSQAVGKPQFSNHQATWEMARFRLEGSLA